MKNIRIKNGSEVQFSKHILFKFITFQKCQDYFCFDTKDEDSKLSKKEFWSTGTKNNKRILDKNIIWDETISNNEKMILFDSQTSGGLLLSVEKSNSKKLIDEINSIETFFAKKIGETINKSKSQILVDR